MNSIMKTRFDCLLLTLGPFLPYVASRIFFDRSGGSFDVKVIASTN